jgi:CubicO group peptidase (beta-lactamase class C family)
MNSRRRLSFIALLLILLSVSAVAFAQSENIYLEPEGRFSVPVPTNWTVETQGEVTTLREPGRQVSASIVVVEAASAAEGITAAWQLIDPEFDLEVTQSFSPPPPPGEDELLVNNYALIDNRFVQVVARRVGETTFVLAFDGDVTVLTQRNAQAQQIASGLTLLAVETTDLSGVAPLPVAEVIDALESYAADLLIRLEVPGAAIAIVENGEIVYTGAFGFTRLGGTEPVTPEMQFLIGSTTKPMTTTMMASLVDAGLLDWDTPVTDLLPNFAVADADLTRRFTLRNLVCACTGVPRRDFELVFNGDELTADDIIASLATFEFFTDFGEAFQYSNQLVAAGGYAAAAAFDRDASLREAYLEAMQAQIFDPIGMTDTTFDFAAVEARGSFAIPHGASLDGVYRPIPLSLEKSLLMPIEPAGGAWSTVGDMARYMLTMIGRGVTPEGVRVVSEDNLSITWEAQVPISADVQYGLGWILSDYNGVPVIGHDGNTLGMTSGFSFLPEQGIGIVVLANAQGANTFTEGVMARLRELLYEQPAAYDEQIGFILQQAEAQFAELSASIGDAPAQADVADYLGDYSSDVLGTVRVSYQDGMLRLDAGEFVSELRPSLSSEVEDGAAFVLYDPPLPGVPVVFRGAGADVSMTIGEGLTTYTFR